MPLGAAVFDKIVCSLWPTIDVIRVLWALPTATHNSQGQFGRLTSGWDQSGRCGIRGAPSGSTLLLYVCVGAGMWTNETSRSVSI